MCLKRTVTNFKIVRCLMRQSFQSFIKLPRPLKIPEKCQRKTPLNSWSILCPSRPFTFAERFLKLFILKLQSYGYIYIYINIYLKSTASLSYVLFLRYMYEDGRTIGQFRMIKIHTLFHAERNKTKEVNHSWLNLNASSLTWNAPQHRCQVWIFKKYSKLAYHV